MFLCLVLLGSAALACCRLASMRIAEGKCSQLDHGAGCSLGAGKDGAEWGSLWQTQVVQGKCVPAVPEGHPRWQPGNQRCPVGRGH